MIELRPLFRLEAQVDEPRIAPGAPLGDPRFIHVSGGTFAGERLKGVLLDGSSDWQLVRADGVAELDVRVSLQCDAGPIVFMKGWGMRHGPAEVLQRLAQGEDVDPALYYFREAIMFEAPAGKYEWLNRVLALGSGRRDPDLVTIEAFEVL